MPMTGRVRRSLPRTPFRGRSASPGVWGRPSDTKKIALFLIQEGAIGRNSGSMRGYRLLEGCTIQKGRPVGVSSLSAPMKSWYRRRMRHNMCCTIGFWLGGASDQT